MSFPNLHEVYPGMFDPLVPPSKAPSKLPPLIHESYVELCRMQLAGFQAMLGNPHGPTVETDPMQGSLFGSSLDGGPLRRVPDDEDPSLLEQVVDSLNGLKMTVAELQNRAPAPSIPDDGPEGKQP